MKGEEETKSEGIESVADDIELRSRVQELEDKLKKYEQTREELIYNNTALELKLKASQMEEGRVRQEMANLEERLLPVLRSQVRRHMHSHLGAVHDPDIYYYRWICLPVPTRLCPLQVIHCCLLQNQRPSSQ